MMSERIGRVLVVEDDPSAARAIADVVRRIGYAVHVAATVGEAREIVARTPPDLALVDEELPDGRGVALAAELSALGVADIVMISASGSRDVVVEALRAGVHDFLKKPVRLSRVRRAVLGSAALQRRAADAAAEPAPVTAVEPAGLVGRSRASRALRARVERLARVRNLRALIVGPPGTDKRRVAARLHAESGAPGPALFVDCAHEIDAAAMTRFFGRAGDDARGVRAVPGYLARARDGTLVLDDLSLLPRDLQSVLCTALLGAASEPDGGVERSVGLRCGVVGILREPARIAVSTGRLSADLHLTLSGAILEVPSLDERREDIAEIAERFVAELNASEHDDKTLSDEFAVRAAERPWPGNLLQLRNALRTAYARAGPRGPIELGRNAAGPSDGPGAPVEALVGMRFEDVRRQLLRATLEHAGGDKRLCASLLGISLKTVYAQLERSERSSRRSARAGRAARPRRDDPERLGGPGPRAGRPDTPRS